MSVASLLVRAYRFVVGIVNTPVRLVGALVLLLVVCGESYAVVEEHGPIEGLWWALVTATTVGYGDQYPKHTPGRAVAAVLMVSMFVLVLCAGAQITARLVKDANLLTDREQRELQAAARYQIAMLEALCAERGVKTTQALGEARLEYQDAALAVVKEQEMEAMAA